MKHKHSDLAVISTIPEYLTAISNVRERFPRMAHRGDERLIWFRGQESVHWGLSPKFYRPEYKGAWEPDMRDLFQGRALQILQGNRPQSEWEWYFLMQHHGAPTRLLDWSDNPLIALFFAVYGHQKKLASRQHLSAMHSESLTPDNAVVWILDPRWLNAQNSYLVNSGIEGPILSDWIEARGYLVPLESAFDGQKIVATLPVAIEPPHVDARLNAQGSRFVVFGTCTDLLEIPPANTDCFGLGNIQICFEATPDLEHELARLGIHSASVFPNLDGLGRFVCDSWATSSR